MLAVATREQPQDVDLFVTLADRESESAASSPALDADDLDESAALTPKQSFEGDEEDGETRTNEACEQDSKALEAEAFEPEDPLERSLQRMLQTRCFSGLDGKTTSYLYTTQLTHSNVVSTVVTSRPFNLKRRQNSLLALNNSNNNDSDTNSKPDGGGLLERKKGPVGGDGGSQATHVYGQPCNPKKVRNQQKGKYQAQLPAFRRSLPSLPIPVSRLNQELIQERDKFMAQLHKEREEKTLLENWAATKLQACYRGYRSRPRVVTYQIRQQLNSLRAIRLDLSDMKESLKKAEEAAGTDLRVGSQQVSPWRKDINDRAGKKHDMRTHKERIHSAATLIQACVKRFLVRFGYVHLLARHYDEVRLKAVIRVQSIYRGFRLRNRIHRVVAKLQQQAVVQIQSLIRGIQARERVCILRFEQKSERRRLAGQPLQFSLPSRTRPVAAMSSLRPLYEHRKTRAKLEFKSAKWKEEQMYLRIHKVAVKLCINRSILHRRLLAEALSTPKKRKSRASSAQKSVRVSARKNSVRGIVTARSQSRRRELQVSSPSSSSGAGGTAIGTPPCTPGAPQSVRRVSTADSSSSSVSSSRALTGSVQSGESE